MLPTPEEKRIADRNAKRVALLQGVQARTSNGMVDNPAYRKDPFDPNSALPQVPSDPKLGQPLASGRYPDPRVPSELNAVRMAQVTEFRNQPVKYMKDNDMYMNDEQSLLDKGKSVLGRIFDYNDPADAQFLGVDLSAVESVWDNFLRYFTGSFDLLNVGFGGLISAAPGGVETLSFDQLSGGKTAGQVFSGQMEPGSAPSPGQIAIASIAKEAKRIRSGEARLSDVLLVNPATAPFILAALAAESSPLQDDDFDLMDKEKREKAFGSGFEQWFSGITDAGLMFADPLIGVGVAIKVGRAGALGARTGMKSARETDVAMELAMDNAIMKQVGTQTYPEAIAEIDIKADARRARVAKSPSPVMQIQETGALLPIEETATVTPRLITSDMPRPEGDNPFEGLIHDIVQVEAGSTNKKVMPLSRIDQILEFTANPNRASMVDLLFRTTDPVVASLIIRASAGSPSALKTLKNYSPAMADQINRANRDYIGALTRTTEPQKIEEAKQYMNRSIENFRSERDFVDEKMRELAPTGDIKTLDAARQQEYLKLEQNGRILDKNIEEVSELHDMVVNGRQIDPLDYTSAFFQPEVAKELLDDLLAQKDVVTEAINKEIFESAVQARMTFPTRNNTYSRMVIGSRERRADASFQYRKEGAGIFPKQVLVSNTDGTVKYESTGWFSASEFGVSRIRRAARVWRWMGIETPSGWIGLKGTATVGTERELEAALKLKMYDGAGVTVTGPDGQPLIVGGRENKERMMSEFYRALNDPNLDSEAALFDMELKIASDFAAVYGVDPKALEAVTKRGALLRDQQMQGIRDGRGYYIDPGDPTPHIAPWLEVHAANGTYMQNFQEMEKVLDRVTKNGTGAEFSRLMEIPAHLAASGYNAFNNFWRPMTLLRLSYTQRNIAEGLFRAMAYQASLAPLLWPAKATYFGVRNKVVDRAVKKNVKKAYASVEQSEYASTLRQVSDADSEMLRLKTAIENPLGPDQVEPTFSVQRAGIVQDGESPFEELTAAQFEARVEAVEETIARANGGLAERKKMFDEAVEGTEFGTWRKQQLKALEDAIKDHEKSLDDLEDIVDTPDINGNGRTFGDASYDRDQIQIAQLRSLGDVLTERNRAMMYDPSRAIGEYKGIAGRQRRIGSGTSMGPDGNFYGDGFTGPLEQINRQNMSADNTVKQSLSLRANIWQSNFTRIMVNQNKPVALTLGNEKEFYGALAGNIDLMASSNIVRELVIRDFDRDAVVTWLLTPGSGRTYLQKLSLSQGDTSIRNADLEPGLEVLARKEATDRPYTAEERAKAKRIKPLTEKMRAPSGEMVEVMDRDQIISYVDDVAARIERQVQGRVEFLNLLRRRVGEKRQSSGVADIATRAGGIDATDVEAAFKSMPADVQRGMYGKYTIGDEIIQLGAEGFLDTYTNVVNKMFKYLGTIPEDAITRGGFYNMRFKATRNTLIEAYWARVGVDAAVVRGANKDFWKQQKRKAARGSAEQPQGMTLEHPPFSIPASELSRIEVLAHRRSLKDTREWMYTIERRTNLGKYGEWIYPFISAQQNSITVMGKLLYKEPWLAPALIDLWRAPTRLGIEDEEGNISLPMPLEWVRETLKDNPNIPVIGGVVDSMDNLQFPKNGLNMIMPESGFGLAPRPTPWIQVGASELMKANMFPVETPQVFRSILGDQSGDEAWTSLKEYIFGEEGAASSAPLSYDKILPAAWQKVIQSRNELSAQYGYQWSLQWHTQTMRFQAGERDDAPTEAEINKRTTNMLLFSSVGGFGIPTPLTPYPIVTRPLVDNPATLMADTYQVYKEKDPLNASMNFNNMFGDWALQVANTKVTSNVGGANASAQTISDINTLDPLIRQVTDLIGDDLGVLGILVNNRGNMADYDASAYQWQKAGTIPGTNRQWREVQSPGESLAERQRLAGWTFYRQELDKLDARLENAGFTSYEAAGAAPYKQAKEILVFNMSTNPEYQGWLIDFQDRGGARTNSAVRTMEAAINSPEFQKMMFDGKKEGTLGAMVDYVRFRAGIIQAVETTGKSIEHDDNYMLKIAWLNIRQSLKNGDVRFAEIMDLYLSNDENPQFPGIIVDMNAPLPMMQGE